MARPTHESLHASANLGIHLRIRVIRHLCTLVMTAQEIDICCSKCRVVICSSNNEWRRVKDVFLITPVQKTCFKTIKIAKASGVVPLKPASEDLQNAIVSEATCAQCGGPLGHGFRDSVHGDPKVNRFVVYDALFLAWLTSQQRSNIFRRISCCSPEPGHSQRRIPNCH